MFYNIHRKGDKAVLEYSRKHDFAGQTSLEVDRETIAQAADQVPQQLKQAIELVVKTSPRSISQQEEVRRWRPHGIDLLERIPPHRTGGYLHTGWYRPLFSTVVMLGVPPN